MKIVESPADWSPSLSPWVYAAGAAEEDGVSGWRARFVAALADVPGTCLVPAEDGLATGPPSPADGVLWALEAREAADIVVVFFGPSSHGPGALLEFGLSAGTGQTLEQRVVVCCPPSCPHHDLVSLTCDYYDLPMVPNVDELALWVRGSLSGHLRGI